MTYLLRSARNLRGMTQDDLAEKIGRSRAWVSFLETGKIIPPRQKLYDVATALGMDAATLFPELGEKREIDLRWESLLRSSR